jgi:hypothetical protein
VEVVEPMIALNRPAVGYVLTIPFIFALGLSQALFAQQGEPAAGDLGHLIKEALASGNVHSSRQLLLGFRKKP